jgi:hypothetical protein
MSFVFMGTKYLVIDDFRHGRFNILLLTPYAKYSTEYTDEPLVVDNQIKPILNDICLGTHIHLFIMVHSTLLFGLQRAV